MPYKLLLLFVAVLALCGFGWRGGGKGNSGSLCAGVISMYAGSQAPTGYLMADGAAVSRAEYSALYQAIGTTYGAGNGTTTFNLPNIKGRVPVGRDAAQTEFNTLAGTGGAKTHVLATGEMPQHSHSITRYKRDLNVGGLQGPFGLVDHASGDSTNTSTGNSGSGTAHNNLQPYIVVNYIIKY